MSLPKIVSPQEWQIAHEKLMAREKEVTRILDALAAERRRQPMVAFEKDYVFVTAAGDKVGLADLFDGQRQLIVYHFMMEAGSDHRCPGCSAVADNLPHLEHLEQRDTRLVLVSPAPQAQLQEYRERMGWPLKWLSCDQEFNDDCGAGAGSTLSVFLRDGEKVYRTYFTSARGLDKLRLDLNLLDLTPYGRQELWEDSPEGWPQTAPYQWWRPRDMY